MTIRQKTPFQILDEERAAARAQHQKDKAAYFADIIKNAPQRAEEEKQAKLAEETKQAAEQEALFKASVRESYIAANGSDTGFNDAWLSLREEIVRQRTIANVGNKTDLVDRYLEKRNWSE
jgi:phage protein D